MPLKESLECLDTNNTVPDMMEDDYEQSGGHHNHNQPLTNQSFSRHHYYCDIEILGKTEEEARRSGQTDRIITTCPYLRRCT